MPASSFQKPPRTLAAPLSLDPASWSPKDIYRLQTAIVVPRPVAWVSTRSRDGIDNLAPHSYFNAVSDEPPMVMFCIEGETDTYVNVADTGEFVVNLVDLAHAEAMETSAVTMPAEEDEFEWAGVGKQRSECVGAPRVADTPAAMECELEQWVKVGKRNHMALGRVVRYHVSETIWRDGRIDPALYRTVGRLAAHYCEPGRRFRMRRPAFPELAAHGKAAATDLSERVYLED